MMMVRPDGNTERSAGFHSIQCVLDLGVRLNELGLILTIVRFVAQKSPPIPRTQERLQVATMISFFFFFVTFPNRVGFHVSPTRVGARVHAITHSEFNNQSLVIGTAYRTK